MRRRHKFIVAGLVVTAVTAIIGVPVALVLIIRHNTELAVDCYVQERVGLMIIEHLERNQGRWPKDWNELAEAYETCEARIGLAFSLEQIRERCAVDFTAKPSELAKAKEVVGKPPFKVVSLLNGKSRHWIGGEPNQMILEYLKSTANHPADYAFPARPVDSEKNARRALLNLGVTWELDNSGHVISVQSRGQLSDQELRHVAAFHELLELNLAGSQVSDTGIALIANLPKLRTLVLTGTNVSSNGSDSLKHMEERGVAVVH